MNELDKEDTGYFLPHRNHISPTSFERPYIILFELSISPKSVNKRLHNHHFKKSLLHTGTPISYITLRKDELRPTPLRQRVKKPPHQVNGIRTRLLHCTLGVQGKGFGHKKKVLTRFTKFPTLHSETANSALLRFDNHIKYPPIK